MYRNYRESEERCTYLARQYREVLNTVLKQERAFEVRGSLELNVASHKSNQVFHMRNLSDSCYSMWFIT